MFNVGLPNAQNTITQYLDKMNKGELTIEDILDNDDIIQEIKTNQNSKLLSFFSNDIFQKLIDYSIKMPSQNDNKIGHKFPFNATEILSNMNENLIDIYTLEKEIIDDKNDQNKKKKKNNDNCKK